MLAAVFRRLLFFHTYDRRMPSERKGERLSLWQDYTRDNWQSCTEVWRMSALIDTQSWATQTFGTCELGDQRRTRRLVRMAERIAENPAASFPDQMVGWAELKAAYRFFDQERVSFQAIATPHWMATRQNACGRMLVICDTTEIDFGRNRTIDGVGPTGNGSGQGFLLHNAMMVDAQTRAITGIAGQTIHYRPRKKHMKKENRSAKLRRCRESEVWGHVIDEIGPPSDDARYTYVCDRGADNFEVFCHLRQQNSGWIIRAKAKNRNILTPSGDSTTLQQHLQTLKLRGTYELTLRARPQQPARTASIEVLTGSLQMPVPHHKSPWIRSLDPEPIAMNVVLVREIGAADDVTPIEWVLYTSESIDTFDQVWSVIDDYESRWLVEEYHKALKSGTRMKDRQLKAAGRLEAMAGLMSIVAVHLVQLKTLSRTDPDRKARRVVPVLWLQMLKACRQKLRRVHDLTVYEFYREVAKLGGFIGRKSDGEPGWITIWRGWEKLSTLVRGAQLAKTFL